MQLAMIGLGRMGGNMVERLMKGGHSVVAYDRSPEAIASYEKLGAIPAKSLAEVTEKLTEARKIVWIMVPTGKPVDDTIDALLPNLKKGDVIIDGGNSDFHDSIRRGKSLAEKGIEFVDSGTSGGVWGLKLGYCLMIGATEEAFAYCEPIFKTLAPENGYSHVGPWGAGHYVKMVHNGIEYGLLQAYAEGYEILNSSKYFKLDLKKISTLWNQGSVVRSWINELAQRAFEQDATLADIKGYVEDNGMGRWTVLEAIEQSTPAPLLTLALLTRFRSRQGDSFTAKVIAALRNQFGGHAVKKA